MSDGHPVRLTPLPAEELPVETRRAELDSLLARYREALAANGWTLDAQTVRNQYRLFSIYAWIAAVSTAAMGSQWQPSKSPARP